MHTKTPTPSPLMVGRNRTRRIQREAAGLRYSTTTPGASKRGVFAGA